MQETIEQATLTADAVVLALNSWAVATHVLLVKGKYGWCLPGGKVRAGETTPDAFIRELREEAGLTYPFSTVTRVDVFGEPGRDPRGRYVSFAYLWRVQGIDSVYPVAGSDAKEVRWFSLDALPILAFDHREIIEAARRM